MHSASIFAFLALICVIQLPLGCLSRQPNSNKFLGIYPIPPVTPSTIDIDTKEAKEIFLTPFQFYFGVNEKVAVVNTGYSVEVYLNQTTTVSKLTGGPLLRQKYRFYNTKFFWTNNVTGSAGVTIDGKGAPLISVNNFYNTKYGTFDNAINYRDGLGQAVLLVKIGGSPNLLFNEFAKILRNIRKPGSKAVTYFANSFKWFDHVSFTSPYYAYPGSYLDVKTGHTYYCTTTLVYTESATLSISAKQFKDSFVSLLSDDGKPLSNSKSVEPSTAQVVHSFGNLQFPIPTRK